MAEEMYFFEKVGVKKISRANSIYERRIKTGNFFKFQTFFFILSHSGSLQASEAL